MPLYPCGGIKRFRPADLHGGRQFRAGNPSRTVINIGYGTRNHISDGAVTRTENDIFADGENVAALKCIQRERQVGTGSEIDIHPCSVHLNGTGGNAVIAAGIGDLRDLILLCHQVRSSVAERNRDIRIQVQADGITAVACRSRKARNARDGRVRKGRFRPFGAVEFIDKISLDLVRRTRSIAERKSRVDHENIPCLRNAVRKGKTGCVLEIQFYNRPVPALRSAERRACAVAEIPYRTAHGQRAGRQCLRVRREIHAHRKSVSGVFRCYGIHGGNRYGRFICRKPDDAEAHAHRDRKAKRQQYKK